MKKLFFYITMLMLAVSIASCSSDKSKVKSAFNDYVQSNFDDPKDLMEIVAIDSCDTVGIKQLKTSLVEAKELYDSLKKENKELSQKVTSIPQEKLHKLWGENPAFFSAYKEYIMSNLNAMQDDENVSSMLIDAFGGEHVTSPDERYKKAMEAKGNTIIQYTIKARVNIKGKPTLQTYYAICDSTLSSIKIGTRKVQVSDVMEQSVANEIADLVSIYSNNAVTLGVQNESAKEIINYVKVHEP